MFFFTIYYNFNQSSAVFHFETLLFLHSFFPETVHFLLDVTSTSILINEISNFWLFSLFFLLISSKFSTKERWKLFFLPITKKCLQYFYNVRIQIQKFIENKTIELTEYHKIGIRIIKACIYKISTKFNATFNQIYLIY